MSLRAYKFLIVAVVQRVEDGTVIEELNSEQHTVFGAKALELWAQGFEADLEATQNKTP